MADTGAMAQDEQALQAASPSMLRRGRWGDVAARYLFLICAILIIAIIIGVFVFVGANALGLFTNDPAHAFTFFTSMKWSPDAKTPSYGALVPIIGSVVTTLITIVIVAPLAFGMALFMTELCPKWLEGILRPLLEILTGMPSVVIGFLGLTVLVPWVRSIAAPVAPSAGTAGFGWGTAILVLVIMVLPTVVSISVDSLRAVPQSVREASLALGSTRWQMMVRAVIPAATTGLGTAVVLGMGRAIGETFAVTMVLKGALTNTPTWDFPGIFFQPNNVLTSAIVNLFGETSTPAQSGALMMFGFVLLIISFIFVCISRYLGSRSVYK